MPDIKAKWTVRNLPVDIIEMLLEVQEVSGGTIGELLTEAVEGWYQALPSANEEPIGQIVIQEWTR